MAKETGHLKESRTGRNVQHQLVPLLRQSVYRRLAGYEDTSDAERLAQDPAIIIGSNQFDDVGSGTQGVSIPMPQEPAPKY